MKRWWNALILLLATAVGVAAFLAPFVAPVGGADAASQAHAGDAPFTLLALTGMCLVVVIASLTGGAMNARTVALLGILSAANAILRAIPGPAGFSAIFFLLVLCGHTYGSTFGFLLGALSLLVSAMLGAGVGPWLPFQMFAAGWVGLTAGWLPHLPRHPRLELALLAGWGALWGLAFGAIMNLWFWPYIAGAGVGEGAYWEQGIGLLATARRYLAFYVLTSLWWDVWRATGNAALILFLGGPLLRVLRRFRRVLEFERVGGTAQAAPSATDETASAAR
ncbi:MAG: ECF transporter S component [Chloroflexi bacterium]|nr:ECF transporter S component [Chloroflexota bacterium]